MAEMAMTKDWGAGSDDGPPSSDAALLWELAEALDKSSVEPVQSLVEALDLHSRRAAQRWLNGQNEVPPAILLALEAPLAARIAELEGLLDELRARNAEK